MNTCANCNKPLNNTTGWIYREGGAWVPKEIYKKQGLITAKAQTRPDYSAIFPGARKLASPKIHLTPKGLHKLRIQLLPPIISPTEPHYQESLHQ